MKAVLRDDSEGEMHVDGHPGAFQEVEEAALPAVVGRQGHVTTLGAAEGDAGAPPTRHGRHQSVHAGKRRKGREGKKGKEDGKEEREKEREQINR